MKKGRSKAAHPCRDYMKKLKPKGNLVGQAKQEPFHPRGEAMSKKKDWRKAM